MNLIIFFSEQLLAVSRLRCRSESVYKQLVLQVRVQLSDVLNGLSEQQKQGGDSGNTCAACKHCRGEVVKSCTN